MRFFATLEPQSHSKQVLVDLFKVGMTGIRLNLFHGSLAVAKEWLDTLAQAAKEALVDEYELLVDLIGPEACISGVSYPILLNPGDNITIGEGHYEVPAEVFDIIACGDTILIDDGYITATCLYAEENHANLEIIRGGWLENNKSLAIEGKDCALPTLCLQDLENISQMQGYPVTGVMLPFVRNKEDLIHLRKALDEEGLFHVRILAKIENRQGIENLIELLPYCDEIVIARGDLGSRMPIWELPAVQKEFAELCIAHHKPFMVVMQMLESMIQHPILTQAEVFDIFNAVLDGADSLMITGATACPVEAVDYLTKIANEAVRWQYQRQMRS